MSTRIRHAFVCDSADPAVDGLDVSGLRHTIRIPADGGETDVFVAVNLVGDAAARRTRYLLRLRFTDPKGSVLAEFEEAEGFLPTARDAAPPPDAWHFIRLPNMPIHTPGRYTLDIEVEGNQRHRLEVSAIH